MPRNEKDGAARYSGGNSWNQDWSGQWTKVKDTRSYNIVEIGSILSVRYVRCRFMLHSIWFQVFIHLFRLAVYTFLDCHSQVERPTPCSLLLLEAAPVCAKYYRESFFFTFNIQGKTVTYLLIVFSRETGRLEKSRNNLKYHLLPSETTFVQYANQAIFFDQDTRIQTYWHKASWKS